MKRIAYCLIALLVAGCGGGGGGSSAPVASTITFPVRSGLSTSAANGHTVTLTANGTAATESTNGLCSGSLNQSTGPATTATTFEGAPALSATTVVSISFSNCTPASSTETTTGYYDSNYLPLGFSQLGGVYGVYLVPPAIPNSAKVGDVGVVGSITLYTDSTKTTGAGREDVSYKVEADTATTALVTIIIKRYDASNVIQFTEQDQYRMSSNGVMTLIAIDIQYATGTHLVFRQ